MAKNCVTDISQQLWERNQLHELFFLDNSVIFEKVKGIIKGNILSENYLAHKK